MIESLRNKKILMVVAHPDDELLGCGATFHRLILEFGCTVRVVILGEGITSRSEQRDVKAWKDQLAIHKKNIAQAQAAIGYHEVRTYDLPDNRFDSVDLLSIIKIVEREKSEFGPSVVFTHHGGDLNVDHQLTFQAVVTACRPLAGEMVKSIVTFETPSGTEWQASSDPRHFIPNFFVTVSNLDVEAKIKGMEAYEFERRPYPHPRSPEALRIQAQRWGVAVGAAYAEAFMIIRSVN